MKPIRNSLELNGYFMSGNVMEASQVVFMLINEKVKMILNKKKINSQHQNKNNF